MISELNKRKICRVAAGDNFSVFLSRTGIVLTCGDGSRGCLGRGDLSSSFTPCMVDGLLNMDVVQVACGARHVAAVCSNGQAFAWGDCQDGRLGVGDEAMAKECHAGRGRYVTRPQPVRFPTGVLIKRVFCGDRCTVFIDSNQQCWACGVNRSNKLGLDRRRRFKRTIVVEGANVPVPVLALLKERIVSCCIGANHASYLTCEGKMLVLGQDIDHSYRLRQSLAVGDHQRGVLKRGASSLQRLSSQWSLASNQIGPFQASGASSTPESLEMIKKLDHESLIRIQLENDRLRGFKSQKAPTVLGQLRPATTDNKQGDLSGFARRRVESYLKKSRALKRMPFEGILQVSCTPKFTLVLTNDNRVYFWGTRTHAINAFDKPPAEGKHSELHIGPQLVASCSDECFIKIGATNNSLMDNVQLLGSDQPIVLARNPQLTALSLRDLWILDYEPAHSRCRCELSTDSSCSSHSSLEPSQSRPSDGRLRECSVLEQASNSTAETRPWIDATRSGDSPTRFHDGSCCSLFQSGQQSEELCNDLTRSQRHDAIIEPQPIVSLYVPSMFNQTNCALQLVNLFCFDEDRFFLVLDTTVKLQRTMQTPPASVVGMRTSSSRRASSNSVKAHQHSRAGVLDQRQMLAGQTNSSRPPNIVEELRSGGSSSRPQSVRRGSLDELALNEVNLNSEGASQTNESDDDARRPVGSDVLSLNFSGSESDERECCRSSKADDIPLERVTETPHTDNQANGPLEPSDDHSHRMGAQCEDNLDEHNDGDTSEHEANMRPVSYNCLSLEEPLSMSTFAPGFAGSNLAIVGRTSPELGCETLRRLSFERSQQLFNLEIEQQLARPRKKLQAQQNRLLKDDRQTNRCRHLFQRGRNRSESTVVTGGFEEDTTSMPTWVRNEYNQQVGVNADEEHASELDDLDHPATSVSEGTLTDAMSCGENVVRDSLSLSSEGQLDDDDHYDRRHEQMRELEVLDEMHLNCHHLGGLLKLSQSAVELGDGRTLRSVARFEPNRFSSQPDFRKQCDEFERTCQDETAIPCNGSSPCCRASCEALATNQRLTVLRKSSRSKSVDELHETHFPVHDSFHRPVSSSASEKNESSRMGNGCDRLANPKLESYDHGTRRATKLNHMDSNLKKVGAEHANPFNIDQNSNKSGLRRNILSQSACPEKSPVFGDWNNNPFDGIELRANAVRRYNVNGSRSSLGSLRKSLVRIFC